MLSKPELEEMQSKVRRFRDILATGGGGSVSRSPDDDLATLAANAANHHRHPRNR